MKDEVDTNVSGVEFRTIVVNVLGFHDPAEL